MEVLPLGCTEDSFPCCTAALGCRYMGIICWLRTFTAENSLFMECGCAVLKICFEAGQYLTQLIFHCLLLVLNVFERGFGLCMNSLK